MASIELTSVGPNKVKVIALVREITGFSLGDAKAAVDAVENGQFLEISDIETENVDDIIKQFLQIGAEVSEQAAEDDIKTQTKKTTEKYKPIVTTNNISRIDRDSTLRVLQEVKNIAREYEGYNAQINSLGKKIKEETDVTEKLRKAINGGTKWLMHGVVIGCAIIGLVIYIPLAILFAIIAKIVMNLAVKKPYLKKHEAENNANAERYIQEHVIPLQEEYDSVYEARKAFFESGKKDWAVDVVGQSMFYSPCIADLYDLVKSRRADSIKEALNKYDDAQHKARMEEMQQAIQNASEISARESVKQTAQMEQIEKNTHQTAKAAKASAAYNFGTYVNTRKKK